MKYFSLFSGIGGFELGIQQAYESISNKQSSKIKQNRERGNGTSDKVGDNVLFTSRSAPLCVGYSEIDKYAIQIYQKHFNHKNYGDITKINSKELPDFELLVGGFPCQSFSIAGQRAGFNDTRGTLFFEIARIVREKQPRLLLLENVKGLLSHDKGATFYTIITTLDELGYDIQWQVLNSKNFGVPQNRERVFIIGHLRGTPRPEVFPFYGGDIEAIQERENKRENSPVIPCLTPDRSVKRQNGRRFKEDGEEAHTLTAQDRHGILQVNQPIHSNNRVYSPEGISPALNTMQGGSRQPYISLSGDEKGLHKKINTDGVRKVASVSGQVDEMSDTQRYKTLGNAVTVNVVKNICLSLLN